jgi:hypothetical protein
MNRSAEIPAAAGQPIDRDGMMSSRTRQAAARSVPSYKKMLQLFRPGFARFGQSIGLSV